MKLFETLRENIILAPHCNIQLQELMSGYQRYGTETATRRHDYHVSKVLGEGKDISKDILNAVEFNESAVANILEYCNFIIGKLDTRAEATKSLRESVLLRGIEESLVDSVPAIHPELCEETTIIGIHAVRHLLEQKKIFSVFTDTNAIDLSETINKINNCLYVEESFFKEAIGNTVATVAIVESIDTSTETCENITTTIKEFIVDLENYRNQPRELYEQLDARDINNRGQAILATMESFNTALENAFDNIFLKAAIVEQTNEKLFNTGCAILK